MSDELHRMWGLYLLFAFVSLLATIAAALEAGTPETLAGATAVYFFVERTKSVHALMHG